MLVKNLPMSYRFYDSILRIILEMCSDENKTTFGLKYWLMLRRIEDDMGFRRKLMEMSGLDKLFTK